MRKNAYGFPSKPSTVLNVFENRATALIIDYLEKQTLPRTVTQIRVDLQMEQAVASAALATLKFLGLVPPPRRTGKNLFYEINLGKLNRLQEIRTEILVGFLNQKLPIAPEVAQS
jgi:predicted transcriptional regulator